MAGDHRLVIMNTWWEIVAGSQVWSGENSGDAGGKHRAAAKYAPNPSKPTNSKAANFCLLRNGHPTQSSYFSLYRSWVCTPQSTEPPPTVVACSGSESTESVPSAEICRRRIHNGFTNVVQCSCCSFGGVDGLCASGTGRVLCRWSLGTGSCYLLWWSWCFRHSRLASLATFSFGRFNHSFLVAILVDWGTAWLMSRLR